MCIFCLNISKYICVWRGEKGRTVSDLNRLIEAVGNIPTRFSLSFKKVIILYKKAIRKWLQHLWEYNAIPKNWGSSPECVRLVKGKIQAKTKKWGAFTTLLQNHLRFEKMLFSFLVGSSVNKALHCAAYQAAAKKRRKICRSEPLHNTSSNRWFL